MIKRFFLLVLVLFAVGASAWDAGYTSVWYVNAAGTQGVDQVNGWTCSNTAATAPTWNAGDSPTGNDTVTFVAGATSNCNTTHRLNEFVTGGAGAMTLLVNRSTTMQAGTNPSFLRDGDGYYNLVPTNQTHVRLNTYDGAGKTVVCKDELPLNEWATISVTWDGTNQYCYINGVHSGMTAAGAITVVTGYFGVGGTIAASSSAGIKIGNWTTSNVNRSAAFILAEAYAMGGGAGNFSTLSVTHPSNTTHYNASVPYSFEYQNTFAGMPAGFGENETCGYWFNGVETWLGNQTNSTPITGTLSAPLGHNNFTAFCGNATGGNTTTTRWFTVAEDPMNFTWSATTCPTGYTTAINFSFYDEESVNMTVNSSMDATFTFYNTTHDLNANVSVNATNNAFVLICFVNNSDTYYVDSFQAYQGTATTEYNQRNWFLENATITSAATQNISLYNANETTTKNTNIFLRDENGLVIPNAYITAQRYYPGTNTYLGVAMVKTDSGGEGITYLVPNEEFYRFIVVENYQVTASFTSQQIACDPGLTQCFVLLQKGGGELPGYWQYYDSISSNCGFIAATNISYCTFADSSGLFNYYQYTVLKLGIKNHETICQVNTTSSSGTLTCNTTGHGYGEYTGSLAGYGSTNLVAGHDFVLGGKTALFGTSVAFLAVLLVPTLIFAVAVSPAASLVFAGLSVLITALMGLLVIDVTSIAAIVIIGLLVAWKVKQ